MGGRQSGWIQAKRRRLSRSGDFERVYRQGRSAGSDALVLHVFERDDARGVEGEPSLRLGISVGRDIGGAVQRNRAKRLLREAFWRHSGALPVSSDAVLVARPPLRELAEQHGIEGVSAQLGELIERSGWPARTQS